MTTSSDDDLKAAYMAGYHKRDDEIKRLHKKNQQIRADWYEEMALVGRLRSELTRHGVRWTGECSTALSSEKQ